ncbi:MAG: hypothetical protein ABII01_05180 [Candidatus Woesearchaeota archaeon]
MIPKKILEEFYLIDLILGIILLGLNIFSIYINRFSSLLGLIVVILSFLGYLTTEKYYDQIVRGLKRKKKNGRKKRKQKKKS